VESEENHVHVIRTKTIFLHIFTKNTVSIFFFSVTVYKTFEIDWISKKKKKKKNICKKKMDII